MSVERIVVCGAGPSGIAAAVAAARAGATVTLIERYGFPGGMACAALVNPFAGHAYRNPETGRFGSLIGGLFKETAGELARLGAYGSVLSPSAFDEERLKVVYDRMLAEAGVEVRFHALVTGARVRAGRIEGVDIQAKEGIRRVDGDVFIDATGDGDLAAAAGCPFSVGRPSDGLTQAMTMSFRMAGVDKREMRKAANLRDARGLVEPYFQDARAKGRLDYPSRDWVQFYDYPRPGVLHFNMTRINPASGLRSEDLSRAEIEGRRQAFLLADWLVREVPYFRGAWLEKVACHVGVRETRHVDGAYAIGREDVTAGRKFPDGIARSCYFIDIHSPTGSGFEHEKAGTRGEHKESYAPPKGDWYEIPYRSLLPKGAENLLVPCRALSATHEGAAAVRVMATMTAMGEAAGLAAAEAVRRRCAPAELDGRALRARLRYLDEGPDYDALWRSTGDGGSAGPDR
jgi:hypothetical protein